MFSKDGWHLNNLPDPFEHLFAVVMHSSLNPDVSVIIAVYNADRFLRPCLDSVLAQTLVNLEVICVDDGSTDKSLAILEEYAARDARIQIIRQENAGAGAARNAGMGKARGDYLSFLDADDIFHPDMLRRACEQARRTASDLCIFRTRQYSERTGRKTAAPWTLKSHLLPDCQPFAPEDAAASLFQICMGWAWDKVFRTEWIRREGIAFPPLRNSEDMYFVFTALFKAERICWLDDILVTQRIDVGNSLSNSRNKAPFCFYDCLILLREALERSERWPLYAASYTDWVIEFASWNLKTLDEPARSEVRQRLRRDGMRELGIVQQIRNGEYDRKWESTVADIFGKSAARNGKVCTTKDRKNGKRNWLERIYSMRYDGWMKIVRVMGFRFRLIRKKRLMADWNGISDRLAEMQNRMDALQASTEEREEKLLGRINLLEEDQKVASDHSRLIDIQLSEIGMRAEKQEREMGRQHVTISEEQERMQSEAGKFRSEINLLYKQIAYPERAREQREGWALMSYNYTGEDYYDCDCVNLGDYIQSLAARQYLPRIDTCIPRDEIAYYAGLPVNMIMNGWWWVCPGVHELSACINPLFIAYHVNNPCKLTPSMLGYLKRNEPVGCRDLSTQKILLEHGIKAYFSGCMTLTLGRSRQWAGGNGRVLCCDFDLAADTPIARCLREEWGHLYDLRDVDICTQLTTLETSQDERFQAAEQLLETYRQAALVITTRIHCALPCLGMGIPVILVISQYDHLRFDGLVDLLNRLIQHEDGRIESHICRELDQGGSVVGIRNPEDYRTYRDLLEEKLHTAWSGSMIRFD